MASFGHLTGSRKMALPRRAKEYASGPIRTTLKAGATIQMKKLKRLSPRRKKMNIIICNKQISKNWLSCLAVSPRVQPKIKMIRRRSALRL